MDNYYLKFEDRTPPPPLPYSRAREDLWQFSAVIAALLGAWYILWRWTESMNFDALWFAIPLVVAETCAYFGLLLFFFNLWKDQPVEIKPAPERWSDISSDPVPEDRPISVDIMLATYNEAEDIIQLGIRDAKKIHYPHPLDIRIHVLDDGRRDEIKQLCLRENVGYITRDTNTGYKAGNLRNALSETSGDLIVICDADTRVFPTILERTLGYFRDPDVAWVQTPQWFYDLPEGETLPTVWDRRMGRLGRYAAKGIQAVFGEIRVGHDPFVNDPQMFYDILQRRRNWANASFCCGAGSIHRREAIMEAALKSFGLAIQEKMDEVEDEATLLTREKELPQELLDSMRLSVAQNTELTPFKFHVSEDIYTSLILHSERTRNWKSVLHPIVESKMLSPQDLATWTIQRYKYAGGSLDIAMNDGVLFRKGLSLPQKLMYLSTFYSYFGPIWNVIFLAAPIIYLLTGVSPIDAYSYEFFLHLFPFLLAFEFAIMVGTWGISGYAAKSSYLAFFPVGLKAIWDVAKRKTIAFKVTPKEINSGNFTRLVAPQLLLIALTMIGIVAGGVSMAMASSHVTTMGYVTNSLWGLNNCIALSGIVFAAWWKPTPPEMGDQS